MTRFWVKIFGLIFAMGVATGIVMEFQFGTNWSAYSPLRGRRLRQRPGRRGDLRLLPGVGLPGAAAVRLGQGRARACTSSPRCMVAAGRPLQRRLDHRGQLLAADPGRATTSWSTAAGPRAEIVDFWAVVFNPSTLDRLSHTLHGRLAGRGLPRAQCQRLLPAQEAATRTSPWPR